MLIWLALSDGELIIAPKNIYNHTFKLSMLQIYRPRCLNFQVCLVAHSFPPMVISLLLSPKSPFSTKQTINVYLIKVSFNELLRKYTMLKSMKLSTK